jgi:hypothetical protein
MRGTRDRKLPIRFANRLSALLAALVTYLGAPVCPAQTDPVEFQIVWVVVGEVASADDRHAVRAARQLFKASDLMDRTLNNVRITRIEVDPTVMQIAVGQAICLSKLNIRAYDKDGKLVSAAPLSVGIRQDHKERLQLQRSRRDICVRPAEPGEYPVRLTSLLPAPDGTMRGAQLFLRVAPMATSG